MSTVKPPGYARQLWYRWKSLKLPWRRQFLIGADLAGNTFWEFKDALNSNRFRRIVKYSAATHYGDVKISRTHASSPIVCIGTDEYEAQWHQWLRHTRSEAPTMQEQQYDVSRQAMMKQLAARADERWKSVPSFLDSPARQQPQPAISPRDPAGYAPQTEPEQHQGVMSAVEDPVKVQEVSAGKDTKEVDEGRFKGGARERKPEREEAPWQKQQRGAPSENWQPQAWTPGAAQRR